MPSNIDISVRDKPVGRQERLKAGNLTVVVSCQGRVGVLVKSQTLFSIGQLRSQIGFEFFLGHPVVDLHIARVDHAVRNHAAISQEPIIKRQRLVALNTGSHSAVHMHETVGLGMGCSLILIFGRCSIQGICQGTYPIHRFGLSQHFGQTQSLSMQIGAASRFQNGTRSDVDSVVLNQDGIGINIIQRDGTAGKAVVPHLHGIDVTGEIGTGPGRDIKITLSNNMGTSSNIDIICRSQQAFRSSRNECSSPIGLGIDKGHDLALSPCRYVNVTNAFQVSIADQHLGQIRFGQY